VPEPTMSHFMSSRPARLDRDAAVMKVMPLPRSRRCLFRAGLPRFLHDDEARRAGRLALPDAEERAMPSFFIASRRSTSI